MELSCWRTCRYWVRYYLGARIKMMTDSWLARSAPKQLVHGFFLIDFSGDDASEERFAILKQALRLIEYYDPLRYRSLQSNIHRIIVSDGIPMGAAFFLGTSACTVHPGLLKSGSATVATALVHEATHARLDRLRIRQDRDRHARIEALCMSQEIAFAYHFPETREMNEWIQRMMSHIARLEE